MNHEKCISQILFSPNPLLVGHLVKLENCAALLFEIKPALHLLTCRVAIVTFSGYEPGRFSTKPLLQPAVPFLTVSGSQNLG